jgi:hypothetical protein
MILSLPGPTVSAAVASAAFPAAISRMRRRRGPQSAATARNNQDEWHKAFVAPPLRCSFHAHAIGIHASDCGKAAALSRRSRVPTQRTAALELSAFLER